MRKGSSRKCVLEIRLEISGKMAKVRVQSDVRFYIARLKFSHLICTVLHKMGGFWGRSASHDKIVAIKW